MKSTSKIYGWASGGLSAVNVGLYLRRVVPDQDICQARTNYAVGNLDLLSYHVLLVQRAHEKYPSPCNLYNKITWVLRL